MTPFNWKHGNILKNFSLVLSALSAKKKMFPVLSKEEALYTRHMSRGIGLSTRGSYSQKHGNNGNNADNTRESGGNILETHGNRMET